VGGGAAPSAVLPTRLIALALRGSTAEWLSARLRRCDPPIVARVENGRVLLDLRTVFPEQERAIANAIQSI
jgi:L-seryl-tRNA(Ser) seleniumtransferase